MSMQVVILCGGLGTRLLPITQNKPKSLIKINNTPFLELQIKRFKSFGYNNFLLLTGYLGDQIREFVRNNNDFGSVMMVKSDNKGCSGSAKAIIDAMEYLEDEFITVYGDSYLPVDYSNIENYFLTHCNKLALMTVYKNENSFYNNNILLKSGEIRKYQKAFDNDQYKFLDYGLNFWRIKTFERYIYEDKKSLSLNTVFNDLINDGEIEGYEVDQRFYEIGSFRGIVELQESL